MVTTVDRLGMRSELAGDLHESYDQFCHFMELVEQAKDYANASREAKVALRLAECLLEHVPELNASAAQGAFAFAFIAAQQPETARNIFEGK